MAVKVYQVGGSVRDRLMGLRESKDIDFVCEADDYPTMLAWVKERGEVYLEQPQFWTVRAHLKGNQPADYVLARKDGEYGDGRRPDSVAVGTLLEDLSRRDFAMNAIAVAEDGTYIDPHDGQKDIKNKLIRCVGAALDRFREDALRLLRAVRFAITKGFDFHPDVRACLHSKELTDRLRATVSEDRTREELFRCFAHSTPATLRMLGEFPLLSQACFHPHGRMWLMPTMRLA